MRIAVAFVMITCAFAPLATGRADAPGTSPSRADARADVRARWLAIVDEYERWRDTVWPEEALASGRPCPVPDRIADRSYRGIGLRFTEESEFLARLREIDPALLEGDDLLGWQLLVRQLDESCRGFAFRSFLMPVGGRGGPQQDIPQMADRMPFRTPEDFENHVKRLSAAPQWVIDVKELLEMGIAEGRMPPKATMLEVPAQFDAVVAGGLQALRAPLSRMPDSIPEDRKRELRAQADEWTGQAVARLAELGDWLRKVYLPACRETVAASDLPDGRAWYEHSLRVHTTTAMTADEIHRTGLAEVARIRAEMMQVIARTDWQGADPARAAMPEDARFAAFVEYLRTDPRFYAKSADELLARYRDVCKRIDAKLPALFGTLPRNPYGVQAVPKFMAPTQTTAYYMPGSLRAGNPGWFYANTHALDQRPLYEAIPLALHEAVPGHHLQITVAQELPAAQEFRRDMHFTAFVEGWALYAERLGIEMGFFADDPYADFGRLLYEMWRATRLVVDTGIHAFGWPRQRAIDYMKANTALSELNIVREVDRYIDWPGQACGYKVGELRIRAMRARAEQALGDAFDVRAFHDAVLGAGAIPLDVLDARLDAWIAARKAQPASAQPSS
jgi:uncharacterized protein (DUF885 family)